MSLSTNAHELEARATQVFERVYADRPRAVAFAPGRVELLGNHTDHNGGYVLSVAIGRGIAAAAAPHPDDPGTVEVHSEALGETVSIPLLRITKEPGSWSNYPRGVILELWKAGVPLEGVRIALVSDLPFGAGVSSSAALELAVAEVLFALYGGRPATLLEVAQLCRRAETDFVGVPCGLLDQFSSAFGKRNHALFLDCATLRNVQVPLGREDVRVVVADTGEKHALVDGQYAAIREACERARRRLGDLLPHEVRFLRDVSVAELEEHRAELEPDEQRKAEHVVRENERVLRGLAALRSRYYDELRKLMIASHASSRALLGNSTEALDLLVDTAAGHPACLGAKLTGGGFGGSTVNLVEEAGVAEFSRALSDAFEGRFGRPPKLLEAGISGGARGRTL